MNDPATSIQEVALQLIEEGWAAKSSGKGATELQRRIKRFARLKAQWAKVAVLKWEHDGARRDWNRVLRADRQRFKGHDGVVLTAAGAYATPIRTTDGLATGAFQAHLFMEMSRVALKESLEQDERQHQRLGDNVMLKRCLLALWEQYPLSQTVGDLLCAAGIDTDAGLIEGVV